LALITDLITKKQRNRIDHRRVACFCDTSSPNALAQCQAYYAAYPDLNPDLIFQYDLSTAGAKDIATGWSLWFSDWADFLIDNNIEAICCNPELDLYNPWGYTFNVSGARNYSFLNTLAAAKQFKDYIAKVGGTELGSNVTYYPSDTFYSPGVTKRVWWEHFGGKLGDSDNPTLPESIVTGEGDDLYQYTDKDPISEYSSIGKLRGYFCGEFDIKTDFFGQPISMLPSWRIGWRSGPNNPAEITTAEITAMVGKSIATAGSIKSHIDDPIVSSSRRRNTQGFVGQAMTVDTIAKDMGFTDVKWGYSEKSGGVSALTTWNSKLNTDNYDPDETANTNVAFIENETAGTVGNTYRDISSNYSSGTYRWHAHNTNTFPMPAFIYIGSCLVNQNQQTNGSWCDAGSDAIFDVKDGAFFMDMTSHFLYTAGWAIKNGASGVFGSYEEPGTGQVASGSAIMSNLLRGHQLATSVLFGQYGRPQSTELWGDGLAAPYYNESEEENNMNNVKFQLTATTAYVTYGATLPSVTNGGTGHSVGDVITLNGSVSGSGIRVKVESLGASDAVATYSWVSGGSGWANSEVATQSNTTGSGTTLVFTIPSNMTTSAYPVGFGFFSEALTTEIANVAVGNKNTLYNNEGMEFAFSEFSPSIPDVHAIISVPALNGFFTTEGFHLWVEGDVAENPYGGNLTLFVNGTGYPILQAYFDDGSVVWQPSAESGVVDFSRLIWRQSLSAPNPLPVTILEGDNIGLSLAVPERQSSKSVISRSVISHNTES
jgi:hypothetical protein